MTKDEALTRAREALEPFEKMFREVEARHIGSITETNIQCQISVSDLRKCIYAAGDIKEALAQPDQNLNCKSTQARLATAWGYVKAQPQQEPVAYCNNTAIERLRDKPGDWMLIYGKPQHPHTVPLYASPPQRTWVGLTDEQWQFIADTLNCFITREQKDAIEASHGIKE
jgi:hypothetical protein